MSRRASLLAKEQRSRPKVRFPDELVFLDNIKEGDVPAMQSMLRRVSISIDVNAIGSSGMTPLHNAVMEENLQAVRLLTRHGCDINRKDIDSWTPLHAACANGFSEVAKVLLEAGADPNVLTEDGERPYDLIEPNDLDTVGVMLSHRAMREGFEEEDEDEEDEQEDGEEGEHEEDDEDDTHSHREEDAEDDDVENNNTENDKEQSDSENGSCDEDSLEHIEHDESDGFVEAGSFRLRSRNNGNPDSSLESEEEDEEGVRLHKPPPMDKQIVTKSILKQSNKPQKSLKFET